jgi:hypothetical protein
VLGTPDAGLTIAGERSQPWLIPILATARRSTSPILSPSSLYWLVPACGPSLFDRRVAAVELVTGIRHTWDHGDRAMKKRPTDRDLAPFLKEVTGRMPSWPNNEGPVRAVRVPPQPCRNRPGARDRKGATASSARPAPDSSAGDWTPRRRHRVISSWQACPGLRASRAGVRPLRCPGAPLAGFFSTSSIRSRSDEVARRIAVAGGVPAVSAERRRRSFFSP